MIQALKTNEAVYSSYNHLMFYENINGILAPNLVGRSMLARNLVRNGGVVKYSNPIKSVISLSESGTLYTFDISPSNQRAFREEDKTRDLSDLMTSEALMIYDELVRVRWTGEKGISQRIAVLLDKADHKLNKS